MNFYSGRGQLGRHWDGSAFRRKPDGIMDHVEKCLPEQQFIGLNQGCPG